MTLTKSVFLIGLMYALNAAAVAQQPPVPAAAPSEAHIGDIVVTLDQCVLQNGQTVTDLPKDVQLRVIALNGNWVGCSVLIDGKEEKGWIEKSLVRYKPTAYGRATWGLSRSGEP